MNKTFISPYNKNTQFKTTVKYISINLDVAMVIDRLLLYVFFAITVGGSMGILLSAPNVFEYVNQTAIIEKLMKSAEAEIIS